MWDLSGKNTPRLAMNIEKKPNRRVIDEMVLKAIAEHIAATEQVERNDKALHADIIRACNKKDNELLLRQMELAKQSRLDRNTLH